MNGQPRQGFVEAEVDYRHAQLMAEVAQNLTVRRPRSAWIHDLLSKRTRRHTGRPLPCTNATT